MTKEWYYKNKVYCRPILTNYEVDTILDCLKRCNSEVLLIQKFEHHKEHMDNETNS